ncbi:IucA/IucC family protein [Pseudoduganella sp. UC29_71]|uniref:IucA/IucC family protein n=1 Tax=Pseudoduganella sp. UC29_71 TaxID=3350174 RepID=UPI00366CBA56
MKVITVNAQQDAQLDAARRAMETLLNCYCREVAAPGGHLAVGLPGAQDDWPQSLRMALRAAVAGTAAPADAAGALGVAAGPGVLHISLPHSRARLLVAVAAPSETGNFSYTSAFYAKIDGKPWAILDWEALAATLLRELGQQTGTGHNEELMQQMRDSVGVTAAVLAVADPGPFAAQPAEAFIASEQSLLFGHPFHPAPKSRQAVTHADMLRYSPETGARFPLHYFAVQREHLMQRSLLDRSCDEIVAAQAPAGLAPDDSYALLPVHPWQASHLLEHPLVTAALEQGRLRYLGPQGAEYFPTSSIRTLYHPDQEYFYKCSLNIRITNCVRKNAHYELEGALQVSEIMRGLMPDLKQRFAGLEVLEEPAFMSVDLNSGDAAGDREVSEAFGMILRRGWQDFLRPGAVPLLAGALFGNHVHGAARLRELVAQARGGAAVATGAGDTAMAERWFSHYVEELMYPVLYCYFAHGVIFEPHLQNVLVGVADGMPCQVFLRDFEGVKLTRERYSAGDLHGVSEAARTALWYSADLGWNRVAYCLFVNNFCEAVDQLAGSDALLRKRLWAVVRQHVERYQKLHGDAQSAVRLGELLAGAPLPGKTNLLNRFFKRADRATTYVPVGNPMAVREAAWS